jgi:hypothetical protein
MITEQQLTELGFIYDEKEYEVGGNKNLKYYVYCDKKLKNSLKLKVQLYNDKINLYLNQCHEGTDDGFYDQINSYEISTINNELATNNIKFFIQACNICNEQYKKIEEFEEENK